MISSSDNLSLHGAMRCQQRGVQRVALWALLDVADCWTPARNGCMKLSLSRREAVKLRKDGYPPARLDRLSRLTVIMSPDDTVITVLNTPPRRSRRTSR